MPDTTLTSPVRLTLVEGPTQPTPSPALAELYRGFEQEMLVPLWYEIGDLMPPTPRSKAAPWLWRWSELLPLAQQAGDIVPVGRGGERRAMALANPTLGGRPYVSPTLWCAIQYLGPGEEAPYHRHTQNAFRFVVEGEGVWTVVNGDPIAMRRGDFLPQGTWNWHAHANPTDRPMAWIDGLDIPFQYATEATFFEFGPERLDEAERDTPERSRSERLWQYGGLTPERFAARPTPYSPLFAYRWENTDAALAQQLAMEADGYDVTVEPGHAAVRYTNPSNAGDVLPTIRTSIHRLRKGAATAPRREVGSSVFQVFDGAGRATVGDRTWSVTRGDIFVVPSWTTWSITSQASASDSDSGHLDLFRFADTPIFEKLDLYRSETDA